MRRHVLSLAVLAPILAACSGDATGNDAICGTRETVTVLAASSMSTALRSTESEFIDVERCVDDVQFIFGSSATLAAQVVNGAPVDVFVSASSATMDTVVASGLAVGGPVRIVRNRAALMLSSVSPHAASISSLVDLLRMSKARLKVGLCAPSVPCGTLTDEVLDNASRAYAEPGLSRRAIADTEASSAEDLVTKIRLGELDAGITYVSDCVAAARTAGTRCIEIPNEIGGAPVNASTDLLVVQVSRSDAARRYVEYLGGSTMRERLVNEFGFEAAT